MESLTTDYHVYRFKSTNAQLQQMSELLIAYGVTDICMESTGKYWIPIYAVLSSNGINPFVVHPKYVKQLPGKKTDFTDAIHIASEFRLGKVKCSIILPEDFRNMRDLTRMRSKYVNMRTSSKSRVQNYMITGMFRIGNTLSDVFGKTGQALLNLALNYPSDQITDEMIEECIDPRCKSSHKDIIDSFNGFLFSDHNKFMIRELMETINEMNNHINAFDQQLKPYAKKYSKQMELLEIIPGVEYQSALVILAEIGTDMTLWDDEDSFTRWAGAAPGTHNSASKKIATKCQGDKYLISALCECVRASSNAKNIDPYYKINYSKISKRRGKKVAMVATVKMMLIAIYHMLLDGKEFNPRDYYKVVENQIASKENLTS